MSYVVLLYRDRLYGAEAKLPGVFTIGGGKKDSLQIEGLCAAQVTVKGNKKGDLTIVGKAPSLFYDGHAGWDTMTVLSEEEHLALYVTDITGRSSQSLKLPYNCIVRVGRSEKNHVTIRSPYVSGRHFILRSEAGIVRVEDLNSTNGLYLNGRRISKAKLHAGDVL